MENSRQILRKMLDAMLHEKTTYKNKIEVIEVLGPKLLQQHLREEAGLSVFSVRDLHCPHCGDKLDKMKGRVYFEENRIYGLCRFCRGKLIVRGSGDFRVMKDAPLPPD